jgi:pilus assembly protein CpaE
MATYNTDADLLGMGSLSLLLISPEDQRRGIIIEAVSRQQAKVARELTDYPDVDDVASIIEADHDAVIIDLDPDPERALDVVENICEANSGVTVMVYSARTDQDLLVRCMRAGAREFLTEPLAPHAVAEALVRASARRDELRRPKKKAIGKLFVFTGAKGGSGVTSVAANFAVALARHCSGKSALIDLELELGDVALTLGVTPKFSAMDAIEETQRLDTEFFMALLTQHSSGLAVLAAPDEVAAPDVATLSTSKSAVAKLVGLARERFQHVVVDAGSRPGPLLDALVEAATAVYLVVQVSVVDLRNANRLIKRYFRDAAPGSLEIVLNRFQTRGLEIDEAAITKALTRPASWKVPNDYAALRKAQNTGVPMASEDNSAIARVFVEMAHKASGEAMPQSKRKRFGLF